MKNRVRDLAAVLLVFLSACSNPLVDIGDQECADSPSSCVAPAPSCGGMVVPACPAGCQPKCYSPTHEMVLKGALAEWECDPTDPQATGYGICVIDAGPSSCFANEGACGQDAYCCSGLCSEQGVCEACRAPLEGCTTDLECCAGVCSLNACGG